MSGVVIVTKNQYILASKIHHVQMDEQVQYKDVVIDGKDECVKEVWYQLTVVYSPQDVSTNNTNQSSDEVRECSTVMRNAKDAHHVFRDMIRQIREQIPDQLYLNKALEQMLGNFKEEDFEDDRFGHGSKDIILTKEDAAHDRKSKRVRAIRKAERGSKAVLRKTRRSNKKVGRRTGRK